MYLGWKRGGEGVSLEVRVEDCFSEPFKAEVLVANRESSTFSF